MLTSHTGSESVQPTLSRGDGSDLQSHPQEAAGIASPEPSAKHTRLKLHFFADLQLALYLTAVVIVTNQWQPFIHQTASFSSCIALQCHSFGCQWHLISHKQTTTTDQFMCNMIPLDFGFSHTHDHSTAFGSTHFLHSTFFIHTLRYEVADHITRSFSIAS